MTNNKSSGSRKPGAVAGQFNPAVLKKSPDNMFPDSPNGALHSIDVFLSRMTKPMSAGEVLADIDRVKMSDDAKTWAALDHRGWITKRLNARIYDDGQFTRKELIRTIAEVANHEDSVKPERSLVKQASAMLEKYGVKDDPRQTVAEGIAKASILYAAQFQRGESHVKDILALPPTPIVP